METDPNEVVPCYQAQSLMEANFIANELNDEGIRATCDQIDLQDALGTLEGNPKVYVKRSDLARAEAWLASYEARRKERKHEEELRAADHNAHDDEGHSPSH